jgi:hypothetical protein
MESTGRVRYIRRMDVDMPARAWRQRGASIFREEFDAAEVWLFGSLAGEPRHDDFRDKG